MTTSAPDPWIVVGSVVGVYGVRGWVKVRSYTDPRENVLVYRPWWLGSDGQWREAVVHEARAQRGGIVARIDGCEDREAARELVGRTIAVRRSQLPPLTSGGCYWVDLIGLEVVGRDGTVLGRVEGLLETGANDVLVVHGERERLIPFVRGAVVTAIDFSAGRMTVDWDADF